MDFLHRGRVLLGDLPPPAKGLDQRLPCPPARPLTGPTTEARVPNHDQPSKHELFKAGMAVMACVIGIVLIIVIVCKYLRARYARQRSRNSTRVPIIFGTQEDFLDGDQGPELDHHIWYINTIGLSQSVIDSISVFKYNKGEALVEGSECAVCLSEFQDDESLRLLPKCSHAFHIPCIDTWLRSHKNCPLCRAPIVCSNFDSQVSLSVPSSSDSSSQVESQMENGGGLSSDLVEEEGRNGAGNVCELVPVEERLNPFLRNHSRIRSDLVDGRQVVEVEMQPVRRSVSLDSSSASMIYNAVANVVPFRHQGDMDAQLLRKNSKSKNNVVKRGSSGSLSFNRLMKSASIGRALQKGPVSMKRSFSSSGKCSSSRRSSSSQESILPL